MTLAELSTMIEATVVLDAYVTESEQVVAVARLRPEPVVLLDGMRKSVHGSGATVAEAKKDLCAELAGRRIAFGWRDEPAYREYLLPNTLEPL